LNQISNFQQPKNSLLFLFPFFLFRFDSPVFLLLSFCLTSYSQPYFFTDRVSSLTQPHIRPPTQFPLVIFVLQMLATAFDLPGRRAPLRCVVCLLHCGASSPPPPLPLRKCPHPITSPSLFSSLVTDVIEVPPLLPPSP
jgi:hypothetical protein